MSRHNPRRVQIDGLCGDFFVFGYAFVKKMIILDIAFCCFYNLSMAACNHAVHTYAGAKARPIAGKKAIPNPPQKLLYNMVLL